MSEEIKTVQPDEPKIVYRKFDSDDVVRLRSKTLVTTIQDGKEHMSVDSGLLQKFSVVLGVKSCPWFSDDINESFGITDEIFQRRSGSEFRKIPVEYLDRIFREAQEYNKADYNVKELRKN